MATVKKKVVVCGKDALGISTFREGWGLCKQKCRQMLKVKRYVLTSPVLTEMPVCKLPGYLL